MATHRIICQGCNRSFQAKSPHAKWCSATCRDRIKRQERKQPPASREPEPDVEHPMVVKTREELERAGKLDTFSGQLAMVLATRLASGATSPSSLSKELRTVMAAAMDGVLPPSGTEDQPDPTEPPPDEDLVAKARREREIARQAAA